MDLSNKSPAEKSSHKLQIVYYVPKKKLKQGLGQSSKASAPADHWVQSYVPTHPRFCSSHQRIFGWAQGPDLDVDKMSRLMYR